MISTKELHDTAAKLEADAKKLREAAEVLNRDSRAKTIPQPQPFQGTRAEQLKVYLQRRPGHAATRQEILQEAGIPAGTVASLLGTGRRFIKDKSDLWHVRGTAYLQQQADEATGKTADVGEPQPVAQQA